MTDPDKLREAIWRVRSLLVPTRSDDDARVIVCDAAESALPTTRTVEVWHIEYAARTGMGNAAVYTPFVVVCASVGIRDETARSLSRDPMASCIRVTGPHQQEVPA